MAHHAMCLVPLSNPCLVSHEPGATIYYVLGQEPTRSARSPGMSGYMLPHRGPQLRAHTHSHQAQPKRRT